MALPGDLTTITLTGTFLDGMGNPQSGTVTLTPSNDLVDVTGKTSIANVPIVISVPATGTFTQAGILTTDNANIQPQGWWWVIQVSVAGLSEKFSAFIPSSYGATVDISQIGPVAALPTQLITNPTAAPSTFATQAGSLSVPYVSSVNGLSGNVTAMPLPSGTPASGQVPVATGTGTASAWKTLATGGLAAVAITTTGSTFSPNVTLAAGSTATVTWTCPNVTTATGINPTLTFGTAATRTVYMTVADANGYDAINQVQVFNIGFNNLNDPGISSLPASFNYPSQAVSALANVNKMTGLQILCAANIPGLTGTLDCSGMGQLQHIECYASGLQSVFTSGCTSLVRLCVELNNLTSLNLNPTAPNLLDLRSAGMAGGALTFTPLETAAGSEWHFCVRDQLITNMPSFSLLPVVQQVWIYNCRQSGTLTTSSPVLASLRAEGNQYTACDLSAHPVTVTAGPDGNPPDLILDSNLLTSCNLTGCTGLKTISLRDNAFSQATVDGILTTVDGFATSNGTLHLDGNPAPSAGGQTHVTALQGRGWTVTTGPFTGIQVVQSATSYTFASNVTAGNTVILISAAFSNTSGAMTSSNPTLGGAAVTGTFAVFNPGTVNGINSGLSAGNAVYISCWVLPNCPAGHNNLALTLGGGANQSNVVAFEVSGLGTVSLGPSASGSALTGTAIDAGFMQTDSAGPVFCVAMSQIYGGATGGAPGSPWTTFNPGTPTWAGYRTGSTSGENFAWLQTNANTLQPWVAGIAMIN